LAQWQSLTLRLESVNFNSSLEKDWAISAHMIPAGTR
jgi:hypothetical protein